MMFQSILSLPIFSHDVSGPVLGPGESAMMRHSLCSRKLTVLRTIFTTLRLATWGTGAPIWHHLVTHPTRHLSLMTGTIYVSPQPCRITSWHLNKRLGSSVCFCEEPVLLWRQKELTSSLSPSGLPGRLRQRDHPGAQEQVCEASFSLRWL